MSFANLPLSKFQTFYLADILRIAFFKVPIIPHEYTAHWVQTDNCFILLDFGGRLADAVNSHNSLNVTDRDMSKGLKMSVNMLKT